jgi:hypothetical protein
MLITEKRRICCVTAVIEAGDFDGFPVRPVTGSIARSSEAGRLTVGEEDYFSRPVIYDTD